MMGFYKYAGDLQALNELRIEWARGGFPAACGANTAYIRNGRWTMFDFRFGQFIEYRRATWQEIQQGLILKEWQAELLPHGPRTPFIVERTEPV